MKKRIPRSLKKYLRRMKAEIRRGESDPEKQKEKIIEFYKNLGF